VGSVAAALRISKYGVQSWVSYPWGRGCADAAGNGQIRWGSVAGVAQHNGSLHVARLQRIAIIGAAPEGERLAGICRQQGIPIAATVDDDPEKLGRKVGDTTVEASAKLDGLERSVPIIIGSHRVLGATQRLRAQGFLTILPFAALQILAPRVFPPHMFYDGWLKDVWENKYRWLSSALGGRSVAADT
jgi:hypothetical protein